MKIAVVTSHPPFVQGGHLVIAKGLVRALLDFGHSAELILTPQNRFGRQGAAYLSTWLTDVSVDHESQAVDQVISLRYPSYAVRHPVHVCWINHRMREYYDQWDRFRSSLSWKGKFKESFRKKLIHAADGYLLKRNVRKLFSQSKTIQNRLQSWGGIPSEVLYPPPPPRPYRCDNYGDYFFIASRLTPLKRIHLVIEALAQREADGIRCVIAGSGESLLELKGRIVEYGLSERVRLVGAISDEELIDYLACCRAVCFPTYAEDYGLVSVEAFASRKPVITCVDSGGPAELVIDRKNGLVCSPTAESLAGAMRMLMDDRNLAERMGDSAYKCSAELTWSRTIEKLILT